MGIRKKNKGVIKRYQRVQRGKLQNMEGVIRRYQKKKKRKSKDRQFNVQKFGDVKGEIDHGKTNRVDTIQWP
jgi:hypothetical protein